MISLRAIPFMASTFEELQAWLQVTGVRLAHDHELPVGWKTIAFSPQGCVVMSTRPRKANEIEAMVGFELVPDIPKPSLLMGKDCIPLDFETVGFLPRGQYVLVKSSENERVAV